MNGAAFIFRPRQLACIFHDTYPVPEPGAGYKTQEAARSRTASFIYAIYLIVLLNQ